MVTVLTCLLFVVYMNKQRENNNTRGLPTSKTQVCMMTWESPNIDFCDHLVRILIVLQTSGSLSRKTNAMSKPFLSQQVAYISCFVEPARERLDQM